MARYRGGAARSIGCRASAAAMRSARSRRGAQSAVGEVVPDQWRAYLVYQLLFGLVVTGDPQPQCPVQPLEPRQRCL